MPNGGLLADRDRETQRYRHALYGSQVAMALGLVAVVALPGIEAVIAIGGLVLMAVQHFLWAYLRKRSVDLIHQHEALLIEAGTRAGGSKSCSK